MRVPVKVNIGPYVERGRPVCSPAGAHVHRAVEAVEVALVAVLRRCARGGHKVGGEVEAAIGLAAAEVRAEGAAAGAVHVGGRDDEAARLDHVRAVHVAGEDDGAIARERGLARGDDDFTEQDGGARARLAVQADLVRARVALQVGPVAVHRTGLDEKVGRVGRGQVAPGERQGAGEEAPARAADLNFVRRVARGAAASQRSE